MILAQGEGSLVRPLRVLFLATDALTADVRIRPLLDVLAVQGRIRYACVDRNLALTGSASAQYDVLIVHRNPSTRQAAWLRRNKLPFLYDIDDLLLVQPHGPATGRRRAERDHIAWCLAHATVVTSPSRRLLATLDAGLPGLAERSIYLANAGAETVPPEKRSSKPRLLWVSSALAPQTDEFDEVCNGIAAAARALDTEVTLVGRFRDAVRNSFARRADIAWLAPPDYQNLLATGSFIAAAPLATALQPDFQAFVDCKSDIKIAQFGSNRIAGVYSPAPPYTESDLPATIARANSQQAWFESIMTLATDHPGMGNGLAEHPAFAGRRPSVLAAQLLQALDLVQSASQPFGFRAVPTPALIGAIERQVRRWRSRVLGR
jgi:hypothetical protein